LEQKIYSDITGQISSGKLNIFDKKVIIASSRSWHGGVIGLVAGRLCNEYWRPTILLKSDGDTMSGSCRSIPEFDIFSMLSRLKDFLLRFGGHSFAAGLHLREKDFKNFSEAVEEIAEGEIPAELLVPKIHVVSSVRLSDLNEKLITDLRLLEPFGTDNPEPVFLFESLSVVSKPRLFKRKHVKVLVRSDGVVKELLFFGNREAYEFLTQVGSDKISVVATPIETKWKGVSSIVLKGIDLTKD